MVVGVEMGDDEVVVAIMIHHIHPPRKVCTHAHKDGSSGNTLTSLCAYSIQHAVLGYYMFEQVEDGEELPDS